MGPEPPADRWAAWLDQRRFGGDEEARDRMFETLLHPVRDRVLDLAEPIAGCVVLDVGCGDGLIGFGALDRGAGAVIFSDISARLLEQCRAAALDRYSFVAVPATDIDHVEGGSEDAVTLRSVLIYVADKHAAFREFARVLRPGGRLAIFEPINRFAQREWTGTGYSERTWSP